jgi:hypothetical protein
MDISVLRAQDGAEVDRGGPYLEMSERTPMASPFVSAAARGNRRLITELMARHGFAAYPYEFWHYSQGDAICGLLSGVREPARYGPVDWDPRCNRVSVIEAPGRTLNPRRVLEEAVASALRGNGRDDAGAGAGGRDDRA